MEFNAAEAETPKMRVSCMMQGAMQKSSLQGDSAFSGLV